MITDKQYKTIFKAIIIIACILFALTFVLIVCPKKSIGADLERFEISAAFTPPHNEPVIQDFVARYKLEGDIGVRFWSSVTVDVNSKLWFLQDWRTPEQVGHGFPDAWRGSDWGVKTVRADYTAKLGVDVFKYTQVFVEHQKWGYLSSTLPSSHISEYYWMTGLRFKFK